MAFANSLSILNSSRIAGPQSILTLVKMPRIEHHQENSKNQALH